MRALVEFKIILLLRSMITCHFGIEKVRIRLPQVIKEFWWKRYIVVALLEDIVRQLQARLEPLHANEHIDTGNCKIHQIKVLARSPMNDWLVDGYWLRTVPIKFDGQAMARGRSFRFCCNAFTDRRAAASTGGEGVGEGNSNYR